MKPESATSESTLFVEPFAGLAGDMFLAALLDLGDARFELGHLRALAEAMIPGEIELTLERAWRGSLSGAHLKVATPESGTAPHRGLADCLEILGRAPLADRARGRAEATFRRLAEAEARVHGCTPEEIHFHEVGAADALIDIAGVCDGLERLGVGRVHTTPPLTGSGTVRCAHGVMPVPAPATAELLRAFPHTLGGGGGERLTPTGAALLVACADAWSSPGAFVSRSVGYGAGTRDPEEGPPNIVRVQLGETLRGRAASDAPPEVDSDGRPTAWQLEVNLDDMSAEELGFLVAQLREAGALEVWTSALQMKKDRPGTLLTALTREDRRATLEAVVFAHSTSLGLRWTQTWRRECPRESVQVEVDGRAIRVVCRRGPGVGTSDLDLSPEYDDLAAAARDSGRSVRDWERLAVAAARRWLADGPDR